MKNIDHLSIGSQIIIRHYTLARVTGTRLEEDESYNNAIILMITAICGLMIFSLLETVLYYLFNYKVFKYSFMDNFIFTKTFSFIPGKDLFKKTKRDSWKI